MTQFKNYIITGGIALLAGFILAWSIKPKTKTEFLAGETIISYKDTCDYDRIIADVITESNTIQTGGVKKGKVQKETSTFPVTQVSVQDTDVVTTFSKSYNTGLMRMKVTATVTSKSAAKAKIDMEYALDTIELAKLTTIVNTVVVQKDSVDKMPDQIVKYFPVETTPKKMTYLGIGGLVTKNPKQYNYSAGFSISHGKTSVSLFKDFTQPIKSLDGYSIGINRQLIRMSAK
jgi:hypothetical protein